MFDFEGTHAESIALQISYNYHPLFFLSMYPISWNELCEERSQSEGNTNKQTGNQYTIDSIRLLYIAHK